MCFVVKKGAGWGPPVYKGAETATFSVVMAQLVPNMTLTSFTMYVLLIYSVHFQRNLPKMP